MKQCDWRNYFVPRDAMHSADYAVARCLSVSLSVTKRLISQLFPIPVFPYQPLWQYSDGNSLIAVRMQRDMKITIFIWKSRFSTNILSYLGRDKWLEIGPFYCGSQNNWRFALILKLLRTDRRNNLWNGLGLGRNGYLHFAPAGLAYALLHECR